MTVILGNASALATRMERMPENQRTQAIDDIGEELDRLNEVLSDLLTLARFESGLTIARAPVSVGRLVGDVSTAYAKGRRRNVVTGGDEAVVDGDGDCLATVLKNLLSNADKYSPRESDIEILVQRTDHECQVTVLDRGIGIPPDDPEHFFVAFFRSARVRGSVRGLGLGLTVCKRVVEAHDGRIWASSRDGGGSAFTFALPAATQS